MNRIYLDHAATTPLDPRVFECMEPYLKGKFGNPSSLHEDGRIAKEAIDRAREEVAALIGASHEEIVFTSSGSEANNLALKGVAFSYMNTNSNIVVSEIEHTSVLHTAKSLEKMGFEIRHVKVNKDATLDLGSLEKSIDKNTILVSMMHANNEVGTIEPIEEISAVTRTMGVRLHSDAVQTAGTIPVDVNMLGVDLLSMSAHQFYGPKGIGALFIRKGTRVIPQIDGGVQEWGRRAGTENVPAIVGFGEACRLARLEMADRVRKIAPLRDELIRRITTEIEQVRLNGHKERRLPGNVNVGIEFIEGESVLLFLDMEGISVSTGSACTSRALKASHVCLAMGIPHEVAQGSLQFTLGKDNSIDDVNKLMEVLPPVVDRLRTMSPLYHKFIRSK